MFYIIFLNGIINDERIGCMVYLLDIAQDTPVFLVIVVAILFVFVAVYYFIYLPIKNASLVNNNQSKEDFEDIKYNIFEETKEVEDNLPVINEVLAPVEQSSDIVSDINKEDDFDIKNVTKELESIPRERTVQLTPFELEQEEQAIISYDELVTQSIPRLEISKALKEDVLFDYDSVELPVVKEEQVIEEVKENVVNDKEYSHEETFLNHLKDLKNSLN